jgi:hypothetical protein
MAPAPRFSPKEQEEVILNAAIKCIEETSFTVLLISFHRWIR